ncbi:MAG: hypothetical protein HY567_00575 [Candidatus Kerfeldbacteria bacterium]|nr:hypothetical protein [Candidatus Kerfeldbacteria bacterium]
MTKRKKPRRKTTGTKVRRPSLARLLDALWQAIEKHDERTFKLPKRPSRKSWIHPARRAD